MSKLLSIELATFKIKVSELEVDKKKNNIKVLHYFDFPTPNNCVMDTEIYETDALAFTLLEELKKRKIKTRDVIFCINSSNIHARPIDIPFQKTELQIIELLAAKAERDNIFPIELKNNVLAYSLLDTYVVKDEAILDTPSETDTEDETQDKKKKIKVKKDKNRTSKNLATMTYLAPKSLINSVTSLARYAKMRIISIEYVGNAVYQFISKYIEKTDYVIMYITDQNSILSILDNGVLQTSRMLDFNYVKFVDPILNNIKFFDFETVEDVLNFITEYNVLDLDNDKIFTYRNYSDYDKEDIQHIRQSMIDYLTDMFSGITAFITQYRQTGRNINQLIILNERTNFPDLMESFKYNTNLPSIDFTQAISKPFAKNVQNEDIIALIGSCFSPINFNINEAVDQRKRDLFKRFDLYIIILAIFCCLGYVGLNTFKYTDLQSTNNHLHNDLITAQQAQQIYLEYTDSLNTRETLEDFDTHANPVLNSYSDIVKKIESIIPNKKVTITTISFSETGVNIAGTADSKSTVAKLLEGLQSISYFQNTSMIVNSETGEEEEIVVGHNIDYSSTSESESDEYKTGISVSWSVVCGFKTLQEEEPEPTDTTTLEDTESE